MHTNANCSIVLAALLLSSCGGPPTTVINETATSSALTAEGNPPVAIETTAPAPIAAGKTGQAGNFAFTVIDVKTPKHVGSDGGGLKAEAGETFLVVTYKLKNISGVPVPPSERPTITLIDPRGQSYAPDDMASTMAVIRIEGTGSFSDNLNPNVSVKDAAAWKLDANAFDKGTWRLGVRTDPALTFALK